MKKTLIVMLILILFVLGQGPRAKAGILDDSEVEISSDIAFYSKYIWRGFELDSDPVIQPGVYISAYGFTASIWGSFDLDDEDDFDSEEVDYSIDYSHDFEYVGISVGHIYYDFPSAHGHSKEIYAGAGLTQVPLNPFITWYHDYSDEDSGGGDGDYVVLDVGHTFSFEEKPLAVELAGHVGYNDELFINGTGGDVGLSAGLPIELTDNLTFTPQIAYSIPYGDLEDEDDGNQSDEFYGGCVIAFSM